MCTNRRLFAATLALSLATVAATATAQAPPPDPDLAAKKEAIARLAFLAGIWKGEAWMEMGPGGKHTTHSFEKVQLKAGGVALLIEGRHTEGEGAAEKVVHDALAVVTWDPAAGRYQVSSVLATGRGGQFPGWMDGDAFVWSPQSEGPRRIRYTIRLDDQKRWSETGEMSTDSGATWKVFFGMTLTKVGE